MRRLWWLVAVGVLLAGCTPTEANSSTTPTEPTIGSVATVSAPQQVQFPIDAYLPSLNQTVAIMMESLELLNKCLTQAGSVDTATLYIASTSGEKKQATPDDITAYVANVRSETVTYSPLWGFFNPQTAATSAYDRPPGIGQGTLLLETPTGAVEQSCESRVASVTPGSGVAMPFTVSDLPDGGSPYQPNDSRYVAAVSQWSTCMHDQGFQYATPQDAIGQNLTVLGGETSSKAKAVAVADVQCKVQVNLVGVAVAVQSAYDQIYIDSHRDQLAIMQTQFAAYIAGNVSVPVQEPSGSGSLTTAPSAPVTGASTPDEVVAVPAALPSS